MICLGTWGFRSHEEVGLDFTCNGLSLKAFKQGNDMIWFIFLKDYFGTWAEYGWRGSKKATANIPMGDRWPRMCTLKVEPVKLTDELGMRGEKMDVGMSLRFSVWVTGWIVVLFNEMSRMGRGYVWNRVSWNWKFDSDFILVSIHVEMSSWQLKILLSSSA